MAGETAVNGQKRSEQALQEANELLEQRVAERTVELLKANESLLQHGKQLHRFIESAPVAVAMFDRQMRYLAASRRWLTDYGLAGQDIVGRSHYEVFPEITERVKHLHQRALAGEVLSESQAPFQRANGSVQWVHWEMHPWFEVTGEVGGIVLLTEDITARLHAEEEMIRERQLLRTLVDLLPDFIFIKDTRGRFLLANQALAKAYGRAPSELLSRTDADFMPPEMAAQCRAGEEKVLAGNSACAWEDTLVFPDGQTRTMTTNMTAFRDAQGAVCGLVGIGRDITRRKRTEDELRKAEARYHTLFDTLIEGFCTIEMIFDGAGKPVDYRFLEVNPAFERQTGLKGAKGKRMRELTPGHEAHWFETYGKVALTGKPVHFESEARALGRFYDVFAYRVGDPESRKVAILFNDITLRKRSESLLQRANQTLQAIRDCHEIMLRAVSERELLDQVCRIIVQTGGERMVWVGFAEQDARKTVRPVAEAGVRKDYLEKARITWADKPRGRGPVGTAIRTGKPCLCRNTLTDPNFALWRAAARRYGYGSVISLPLLSDGECFGALCIYARATDAFDEAEQRLFTELANDLAYGIGALRLRAEQERLENEILKSAEREQERIGRDLHDGLCQLLTGAKFRSAYLAKIEKGGEEEVRREALVLEKILNHAIEQTRELVRGLNPVRADGDGLAVGLQHLAENVEGPHAPHCFCRIPKPVKIFDHHVACHLFRIAQEAVQNALKHARAKNISITLARTDGRLLLTVKDDGVGIPRICKKGGMGLANMQTRARLIGGRLEVRRRQHGGTAVMCELKQRRGQS